MKYEAFISYRHGGIDEKIAMQLHKEIERYKIPNKIAGSIGKKRVGRVFRDADELRAASDLSAIIREALDETEWLIVVCTKRYKDSPWCMEEIEYFLQIRGRERIIVILAEGEPEESFPKLLTEVERDGEIVKIEPLAVDVRADSERQILKNIRQEKFRFFASMLSVDYDDLRQRQRERRMKRISAMVAAAFLALGSVIAVIMTKNMQLETAYTALDTAMQDTLKGESYYLAEYANEAYENGDRKTAAMLALEALPKSLKKPDRPFVPSVVRYLTQALGVYDFSYGYQTDSLFDMQQETYDVRTQISEDEKVILLEKYFYAAGDMLTREAEVYSLEDKELLCRYTLSPVRRSYYHAVSRASCLLKDSKTLLYLGEKGLVSADIYTGKENFTAEQADEIKVSREEDHIAAINYNTGYLYSYDPKGEELLSCELGTDKNYTLGEISPNGEQISLATNMEKAYGILMIDLNTGENAFISMAGTCTNVRYIDDDRLCFLLSDENEGLKHIVRYEIREAQEGYLCNADWDLSVMTLTEQETCYYYHGNTIYEVDCNDKKGKEIWKHTFASDINSVQEKDGVVGISCKDGSVSFYDQKTKALINSGQGNGEQFYLLEIGESYAALRDYWGKHVRVYKKNENAKEKEEVVSLDISEFAGEAPDQWYTCSTNGERIILGFQNGRDHKLGVFDIEKLSMLQGKDLSDLEYDSFRDLSIDARNRDYFSVQDYAYYQTKHYRNEDMKQTFSFNEDSYYYYNEDGSLLYLTEDGKINEYEAATGKQTGSCSLLPGYDKGVKIGDYLIYSSDKTICIQDAKDTAKTIEISDAELYSFHGERELLFYRNAAGTKWYVYSLKDKGVVCKGEAGIYSCTTFFGDGKYFFNDYNAVYDMDTWKQVLDLSEISNGVYGVQTTKELPYFVVWYQESDSKKNGKASGSNVAYLYNKEDPEEIVGEIPNFVAMAKDGNVIVYDGNGTLYKTPLYSAEELKKQAEEYVGETEFTEEQKENYHLYH